MTFLFTLLVFFACADETWNRVKQRLEKVESDFTTHELRRIGDQTFEFEAFTSTEGSLHSTSKMFEEIENYPKWILKNINSKPGGGQYFVKLKSLSVDSAGRLVTLEFQVTVGSFSQASKKTFQLNPKSLPDRFVIEAIAITDQLSVVSNAGGSMTIFQSPKNKNRVWLYLKARLRVKSRLLYELLPEKPTHAEAGARLIRAIENYLEWENSEEFVQRSD